MEQHSVRRNFALNLVNTIVGLLFPLVTFPYVARVLNPDGVGIVQFYQAITNYIVLITSLGIPLYAVREVAKVRDDIFNRNKVTLEIILLHILLSIMGYVVVAILCCFVTRIQQNIPLFLLISTTIGFTVIGVSWFYQAVEDFRYITIRSIVFKTLSALCLFIFVRDPGDVFIYALIYVVADVGSNVMNFMRLRKYFKPTGVHIDNLQIKRHLLPSLKIFTLNIIVSIYVQLDSVMLGFLATDTSVGLYGAATRITRVLTGIIASLGTVLLPRMANLVENGKWDEFKKYETKAMNFVFISGLPLMFGVFAVAPEFVPVFSGDKFRPAISAVRIMSPIVLFIGMSTMIAMQILYTQKKENLVIISTVFGAVINTALNFILIPKYDIDGAAVGTVVAEFMVVAVMMVIGRRYIHYKYINKSVLEGVLFSIVMCLSIALVREYFMFDSLFWLLITEIAVGMTVYFVLLLVARNEFAIQVKNILMRKMKL